MAALRKRKLAPRIRIELGTRARQDMQNLQWKAANREAICLAKIGVGIAEARSILAAGAAARPAPVTNDRSPCTRT